MKTIAVVCYGNILRSQVLEQYLRYYAKKRKLNVEFISAGIAAPSEFPDKDVLLKEIEAELTKRAIPFNLCRNPWDIDTEVNLQAADIIACADNGTRDTMLQRMKDRLTPDKVMTFYSLISEGEKNFEDTYDYEKKRQDPIRFKNAFNELDRIAVKIIDKL